jgi:hypothetical protein
MYTQIPTFYISQGIKDGDAAEDDNATTTDVGDDDGTQLSHRERQ